MGKRTKTPTRGYLLILVIFIVNCLLPDLGIEEAKTIYAQTPEQVAPPNDLEYSGLTKCAACHFDQYKDWKTTPHANSYNYLPKKYRNNVECLTMPHQPAWGLVCGTRGWSGYVRGDKRLEGNQREPGTSQVSAAKTVTVPVAHTPTWRSPLWARTRNSPKKPWKRFAR